ncbi:hypothetical protein ABEW05_000878 [Botrytis cinerea]
MDSEAVGWISLFVIVARNSRTQGEFAGGPVGGLHLDVFVPTIDCSMLRKRDNMGPDLEELGIWGIGNGVSRRRGVGVVYLFGLWKEVQRWDLEDWLRGSRNEVA